MTHIGTVIGWKFNHQPGMETVNDVITKFPGGVPSQADQDAWTTEYKAYKAVIDTKAEAYKRIITIIPEWKQSNLNARMNELNKKVAIDGTPLTSGELVEVAAMDTIWTQAKDIRAKSDALEASIGGMTREQLDALDVTNDSHWV